MKHVDTKELKKSVNVSDLLNHYEFEQIVDDGSDWIKALCPYHDDKNPSFNIRKEDTKFHCWSCKASGDAVKLIMDLENINFIDAITKLAGIAGYSFNEDSTMEYLKSKWLKKPKSMEQLEKETIVQNDRIHRLHKIAVKLAMDNFHGSKAQEYLQNRGFDDKTAKNFNLGYFTGMWKTTRFGIVAKQLGYTEHEIEAAGYDFNRFDNRLIFPIFDTNKNIVAISGRSLDEETMPKYTATPNSEYYKKGLFLFGLQNVREDEGVILVEGNLDCVRLQTLDINSLAQLGSSLTKMQRELLKSFSLYVQLMYDGDEAGRKAAANNVLPLIKSGIITGVVELPDGYDPDLFFKEFGKEEGLRKIIKLTTSGLEYYVRYNTGKKSGESILCDCLHAISNERNKGLLNMHIEELSKLFNLSTDTIRVELRKVTM